MTMQFALTNDKFNTQYAPLGLLLALYKQKQVLQPLENVTATAKIVDFSTVDKLQQVLVSILAGCDTISEVNTQLKGDPLANAGGWDRFADQSTLSIALDSLTLMNIDQIRMATNQIRRNHGETATRDWRKFLWLDYDLSGLPSGRQAEGSKKGYFSQKKRYWTAISPC